MHFWFQMDQSTFGLEAAHPLELLMRCRKHSLFSHIHTRVKGCMQFTSYPSSEAFSMLVTHLQMRKEKAP